MNNRIKIVSGGQTGVDRAALDVALELGFACGGYCPQGRLAEDGAIDARYPLTEMKDGGYVERTLKNVIHSDATLIIYHSALEGGTLMTQQFCQQHHKPFLAIDQQQYVLTDAVKALTAFIAEQGIATLNVAGPRATKQKHIYDYTSDIIRSYLQQV